MLSVSDEPVVVGSCNVATLGNPVKKNAVISLCCRFLAVTFLSSLLVAVLL